MTNYCELCGATCDDKFYIRRGMVGVPKLFCQLCFDFLMSKSDKEIGRILRKKKKI